MIKPYPETHQEGNISIENKPEILALFETSNMFHGDLGIQIASDGRIWLCINGIAFIRFKPTSKE